MLPKHPLLRVSATPPALRHSAVRRVDRDAIRSSLRCGSGHNTERSVHANACLAIGLGTCADCEISWLLQRDAIVGLTVR